MNHLGTSTIFRRMNDIAKRLSDMTKDELQSLDNAKGWKEQTNLPAGWSVPIEVHNRNAHVLVWWYGKLIRLSEAPALLNQKYYSRWAGKRLNEYEWTVLKNACQKKLEELDKQFRKTLRKNRRSKTQI